MTLTVELPNDLGDQPDSGHIALEAVAIAAYKSGSLSHEKAARLLNLDRLAFDDLLKRNGETDSFYAVDDLLADIRTSDALRATGRLPG